MRCLACLLLLGLSLPAHAKLFSNSYVSFELPPRWDCILEKTEWTCRNETTSTQKEAVIILTAKETGPADTVQQYEAYLKTAKSTTSSDGKTTVSQVKQVKQIQIAGQPWVDGMHLGSEVPFYYTRYLATVKQQIAILVTFSAHQRYYTKYSSDFFHAIQSLRVIASPNLLNDPAGGSGGGGGAQLLGSPIGIPTDATSELPIEPQGSSGSKKNALLLAALLSAVGGFFLLKRKKKS